MTPVELPVLLTVEQVAELTGLASQTLDNWRSTRRAGPPFVKLGLRAVRYDRAAVLAWIRSKTVTVRQVAV
ncbi:MAG: helix-turn-helix domain-containing protein [Tepidisphaeraceae bacterium]